MKQLARLLHCTEGQAYSVVIVTAVLAVLLALGVPPALHGREPAKVTPAGGPVATTTTIAIPRFGEGG
jgi:hypothetical protein